LIIRIFAASDEEILPTNLLIDGKTDNDIIHIISNNIKVYTVRYTVSNNRNYNRNHPQGAWKIPADDLFLFT